MNYALCVQDVWIVFLSRITNMTTAKRYRMTNWANSDERESALAAKWAQAEDRLKNVEKQLLESQAREAKLCDLFYEHELLDLINAYGNERAVEAYHGPLHCRRKPEDLIATIQSLTDQALNYSHDSALDELKAQVRKEAFREVHVKRLDLNRFQPITFQEWLEEQCK